MMSTNLDRDRYVLGDVSDHAVFLNCERIAQRSHIHRWKVDAHYHEGLAQLFIFGPGRVDGQIDIQATRLDGPALVWLPSLCNYAFLYEEGMLGWVISVPTQDIARLAQGVLWLEQWIGQPKLVQGTTYAALLSEAEGLVRRIEAEHQRHGEERNLVLESLFRFLLVTLHRSTADTTCSTRICTLSA